MIRRTFLAAALAVVSLPASLSAAETLTYTPGLVKERLAAGETLFIDFSATWCSTCKAQEKVIGDLRGAEAAYNEAITFVVVDWDDFGRGELSRELRIPRRSTLVVLKGEAELGRVVAQTGKNQIRDLMDIALDAAQTS